MIEFDRLSLSGFKSFVDKTELEITPGLTGIVGPNGCGKSNLVEALRWAMGESSARRMRGGDMDDVIFNGTSGRPARNFAEVVLYLNNGMHTAPEPYTAFDQIEISRRIERENGSTYRINGKIARARDVQLLLADTMTGANSPALVSQGKLTQIITAKPFDRRMILEESAGITGLHARRHEAELRLQAADNNLARLQDGIGGLETQLAALKRQSRQAEKYRTLTDEIKNLEQTIAAMEWMKLVRQKQINERDITEIESSVADSLLTVTQLTKTYETQSLELPALRVAAAEAAARYQSVTVELGQIDNQVAQLEAAINESNSSLAHADQDIAHEKHLIHEGQALLASLDSEYQTLDAETTQEQGRLPALEQRRDEITAQLAQLEQELQQQTQTLFETQSRRQTLAAQIAQDKGRLTENRTRADEARRRLQDLMAGNTTGSTQNVESAIAKGESDLAKLQQQAADKTQAAMAAEEKLATARTTLAHAREELAKLQAEKKPLEDFLAADLSASHPVLDDIKAEAGFELALAKALGDTLFASTDDQANMVWRGQQTMTPPAFPAGVAPMDEKVKAPAALNSALGFIGYVHSREAGHAVADQLTAGQTLVSLDGYLWRWDGLFIKPTTKDRQAIILEQKNRLAEITQKLPDRERDVAAAQNNFDTAQDQFNTARAGQTAHEQEMRAAQATLNHARASYQKQLKDYQDQTAEQTRLSELLNILDTDNATRAGALASAESNLALLPDPIQSGLVEKVALLRDQTTATQTDLRDASLSVDRYLQDDARRRARLRGIADERIATQNRAARSHEHLIALENRHNAALEKLNALQEKPATLATLRQDLLSRQSQAQQAKTVTDDQLQAAENDVNATARALREAEGVLSNAKETRAGLMAHLSSNAERLAIVEQEIATHFGQTAQDLTLSAGLSFDMADADLTEVESKRQRKEKLIRDRDAIGPVNLRADVEAQEIQAKLGLILSERDDLMAAIDELRKGIATINDEAKERLVQAFETINTNFKDLFTRLFGGGQAYLKLIETDGDPLASGLEIYAQPPGKTLQSISLLSGGEQSLTAAALIFAMFLTNPSPICVLDEIDAPLDDANVDRICALLRHITDTCQTRFLVVTHHRLTMAKMDRLYGVTMAEKGVSQLVSVDLSQQLDLLEAA